MKKFLCLFLLPLCLFGAAGDIKVSYKAANNISWIDAIFAKQNSVFLGLDSNGVPYVVTSGAINNSGGTLVSAPAGTVLQIGGGASAAAAITIDSFGPGGTSSPAVYRGRSARGTVGTKTASQADDLLVALLGSGHDGTSYSTGSGSFRVYAAENFTPSAQGTKLGLAVTIPGSTTSTVAAYVNSDGLVVTNGLFRTTSDMVISGTTVLADIPGLSLNVIAGNTYSFRVKLLAGGTSVPSAGGIKVALSGTCTATSVIASIGGSFGTAAATPYFRSVVTALNSSASNTPTSNTSLDMTIEGTITAATSGTFTIQAAEVTGSGTLTIATGSYMWAQRY